MTQKESTFKLPTVETLLDRLYQDLKSHIEQKNIRQPQFVGIHTGGAWIAQRLHTMMLHDTDFSTKPKPTIGSLNIAFYRDDFSQRGLHPSVTPSTLPFSIDDANLILVDDVLMSGRTIRAALNELFDFGRPEQVVLAVLVDLQANMLPIRPDVCGMSCALPKNRRIKLRGPERLKLDIIQLDEAPSSHSN